MNFNCIVGHEARRGEISITVGISSITKATGFKIFPNPNTGNFTIEIDNPPKADVEIEVFDMLGKLIKKVETIPYKSVYEIHLKLADGLYFVKMNNGGLNWNQKVLVSMGGDSK